MFWPPFQFGNKTNEGKINGSGGGGGHGNRRVTSHYAFVQIDGGANAEGGHSMSGQESHGAENRSMGNSSSVCDHDRLNLFHRTPQRPPVLADAVPPSVAIEKRSDSFMGFRTPIRSNGGKINTFHSSAHNRNGTKSDNVHGKRVKGGARLDFFPHDDSHNISYDPLEDSTIENDNIDIQPQTSLHNNNNTTTRMMQNFDEIMTSSQKEPNSIFKGIITPTRTSRSRCQTANDHNNNMFMDHSTSTGTTALAADTEEEKEIYKKMLIKIEKGTGVISFTIPSRVDHIANSTNDKVLYDDFTHHDVVTFGHGLGLGTKNCDGNDVIVVADDESSSIQDSDSFPGRTKPFSSNSIENSKHPSFQLIPTKNQTHKEQKRKLYHQTRKACLEAAVEAYKSISMDIPDMILAQINDHRNYLSGKTSLFDAIKMKQENKSSSIHTTANIIHPTIVRETYQNSNSKFIKLLNIDEIHVAPCQCALRLVGMEELRKVHRSNGKVTSKRIERNQGSQWKEVGQEDCSIARDFRHSRTASIINDTKDVTSISKANGTSMVRTSSAQVPDFSESVLNRKYVRDTIGRDFDDDISKRLPGTGDGKSRLHGRSDSDLFAISEFHEITLICNQNTDSLVDRTYEQDRVDVEFMKWDAVTIRCSNHDELDLLVKDLRNSSKAKVIPFSSNPKERLRRIRAEKERNVKNHGNIELSGSNKRTDENLPREIAERKSRLNMLGTVEKQRCQETEVTSLSSLLKDEVPGVAKNMTKTHRKPFDTNFNKKMFCELCDLTFTLLTRRHHCRRCERSCCGHCSRILIVKGCDEKRYCNWCASEILQKQSHALRGRLYNRSFEDDALPGKVHNACYRLGVGLSGKLPHWKSYLRPNLEDRPAVGRITVEVIEAIALPSVDMVNAKVDPYVRATITGYDRDMKWTLRQWLQSNRYSLCSRFCSATLSPQWRGTGRLGGELLTLPVISTAGAVLRLEVLHYNVLTNSRGRDQVLGVVEIPLSDLPNANLRHPGGVEVDGSGGTKKNLTFDGYCDRWYRLLPSEEFDKKSIVLSKPVLSPIDSKASPKRDNRKVGMQSLEELGKRVIGLTIAPVEWFASAIKLDLPARRPEAICRQHKARSMIHVRIKLNASIFGDVLSHAWFPPVRPLPLPPPYDPEILLSRILQVGKQTEPYRNIFQFIELCIKWKHPPKVCVQAYFIFAIHVAIFPYLLPLFHIYLFFFLWHRLRCMQASVVDEETLHNVECHDSFDGLATCKKKPNANHNKGNNTFYNAKPTNHEKTEDMSEAGDSESSANVLTASIPPEHDNTSIMHSSPSLKELSYQRRLRSSAGESKLIQSSSNVTLTDSRDRRRGPDGKGDNSEEEITKLNIAIHWVAKRLGDNKGLEVLQFKLGMLGRDLRNINSIWNGQNPLLTRATMLYLAISFILHFIMSQRLLWLVGTSTWYFIQAPFCVLTARFAFGLSRGVAKVMRRQQLLDAELLSKIPGDY